MIFPPALKKTTVTLIASKIYKSCFRSISNTAPQTFGNSGEMSENDMPIQLAENPYIKEKHQCILCKLNIAPDYKNVRLLSQFQSQYTGRIYGKHITGLCDHRQKQVEEEISKAQNAGLMGYMTKESEFVKDPKLFDPNRPFRPHKY